MTENYEKKTELYLSERELICLANHSITEIQAQFDRVYGVTAQIEADYENSHLIDVAMGLIADDVNHEIKKLTNYLSLINLIGLEKRKAKK